MPEGDTIFRSARTLHRALAGRTVTHFEAALAKLAGADDNAPVAGRTVERVESRGKWLLIHFSGDLVLVTHMLMSGSWHIYRVGERWRLPRSAMRIVVRAGDFEAVGFNVPVAEFHTAKSLLRHRMLPKLGPDVLAGAYDENDVASRIAAENECEIADVLLDQRVLAGLGNVYKSEVCFAAKVHPFRKVSTLTRAELEDLVARSRTYMLANVKDGADGNIVTYTGMRRTTHSSDHGARLWVYGRRGQPCRRCGTAIATRKQGTGARSTYWCPECQPYLDEKGRAGFIEGHATPVTRRPVYRA